MTDEGERKGRTVRQPGGADLTSSSGGAALVTDGADEDDRTPVEPMNLAEQTEEDRTPVGEVPAAVLHATRAPARNARPTVPASAIRPGAVSGGSSRSVTPALFGLPATVPASSRPTPVVPLPVVLPSMQESPPPVAARATPPARERITPSATPSIARTSAGPRTPPAGPAVRPPVEPIRPAASTVRAVSPAPLVSGSPRTPPGAPVEVRGAPSRGPEIAGAPIAVLGTSPTPTPTPVGMAPSALALNGGSASGPWSLSPSASGSGPTILPPPVMSLPPPPPSRWPLIAAVVLLLGSGGALAFWKLTAAPSRVVAVAPIRSTPGVITEPPSITPIETTGIEITSTPPGVAVWLDGTPARGSSGEGRTNLVLSPVAPGRHVVELKSDGKFKPWRSEVTVGEGERAQIVASLSPVESAEPGAGAEREREPSSERARRSATERSGSRGEPNDVPPSAAPEKMAAVPEDEPNPASPAAVVSPPIAAATKPTEASPPPVVANETAPAEDKPAREVAPPRAESVAAPVAPAPARPQAPRALSTQAARQQLLIDPNDEQYKVRLTPALERAGMNFWAVLKICVSAQGSVTDVKIIRPADPAIDAQFPALIGKWKYRPYVVDGRPTPFCYLLRYEIDTR